MDVPSTVVLQVSCEGTPDLSDLIVGMRISTGQKNPYASTFQRRTGSDGVASEASLVAQFTDHWAAALMDQAGSLEECGSAGRLLSRLLRLVSK